MGLSSEVRDTVLSPAVPEENVLPYGRASILGTRHQLPDLHCQEGVEQAHLSVPVC